jgi:hypothetical protein
MYKRLLLVGVLLSLVPSVSLCGSGKIEVPLGTGTTVTDRQHPAVERGFVDVQIPKLLDSVYLDVAELVFTASTVFDTTEPLLLAVAPATSASASMGLGEQRGWAGGNDGFDPEYLMFTPRLSTQSGDEVRIEVTHLLRRWLKGEAPNYGFVLKTLTEGSRSTFHWIRDARYGGGDAKLVIHYTRL